MIIVKDKSFRKGIIVFELEEKGTELREPYSASLEDGIFELRCKLGSNITRALYFFYVGKRIVVTNGFVKKTQKTPPKEIKLAKDRRKDWIERQECEREKAGKRQEVTAMRLKDYKEKKMQDPEFAKAYEEIQPEMNVIRAIIEARTSQNLTQKELSERTGIAQTEISRLENGTRNPSIKLLQRLADGMGKV